VRVNDLYIKGARAPMTEALWRVNLYQHLVASKKHFMTREEADKILKEQGL
jgi:hypothetical protein